MAATVDNRTFEDVIREKAVAHHDRYPTFDVERFVSWCLRDKTERWQKWARSQPIARLNRTRQIQYSISRIDD